MLHLITQYPHKMYFFDKLFAEMEKNDNFCANVLPLTNI